MAIRDNQARVIAILDKDVKSKLEMLAKKDKRSVSSYIAVLVEKHIAEEEKKNNK